MSEADRRQEQEKAWDARYTEDIQRSAEREVAATVERITAEVHQRALERAEFALKVLESDWAGAASPDWTIIRAAAIIAEYLGEEA